MDLVETGEHFVLKADLPGIDEGDVNIEVENNVLTVSGERKTEHEEKHEGYYRLERATGAFSRSLTLPEGIDAEGVDRDVRQRRPRGAHPQARRRPSRAACRSASAAPRRRRSSPRPTTARRQAPSSSGP